MNRKKSTNIDQIEITEEVDLCDDKGHLNPEAIGWSRHPYHRCNLKGSWPRKKKWNYWAFVSPECVFSITLADIDYIGLYGVYFYDFETQVKYETGFITPFGKGIELGECVEESVEFHNRKLDIELIHEKDHIQVKFSSDNMEGKKVVADFKILKPEGHETLNVVIPWSEKRFQFTSKQNTLPLEGSIFVDDREYILNPKTCFGILDFGRGKWPYHVDWNWGSFSGWQGDHLVGINIGGQWTEGTGYTENGLCIDGKLYKIPEELVIEFNSDDYTDPWVVKSPKTNMLELKLFPEWDRYSNMNLGILKTTTHQCFGRADGVVRFDGKEIKLNGIQGWIEDCHQKW